MCRIALASIASVLVFSAGAGASTGTGLYGHVVISPAFPVCKLGVPCTRPAAEITLVFSRSGRRVASARTARDGSYRISLRPGAYRVSAPSSQAIGRGLEPRGVTVPRARYGRANFTLDIGIR